MIIPSTEIKRKPFKDYERRRLYNYLRKSSEEKRSKVIEMFKEYLDLNILKKVLNRDLLELGSKPYCCSKVNRFIISPSPLKLEGDYTEESLKKTGCKESLVFDFCSKNYVLAVDPSSKYSYDITSKIVSGCSKEEIDQIKYFLYEVAKAKFEYDYYGLGTFIKPDKYSYCLFQNIQTWGSLYLKNTKMFEALYEICEGQKFCDASQETLSPEKSILRELKSVLGY